MKLKRRGWILLSFVLLGLILPIGAVRGDVPSVLEVEVSSEGGDTILIVEIRHNSPSSSHFVDSIEARIDDGAVKVFDQDPQNSTKFTVEIVLKDTSANKVEVRSYCTNHGWSTRAVVGEEEEPEQGRGGIPGFPMESLALGIAAGILLLWVTKRG